MILGTQVTASVGAGQTGTWFACSWNAADTVEVDLADVSWRRTDPPVPFALDVPDLATGRRSTVRVHVSAAPDRDPDQEPGREPSRDRVHLGDQVGVESVPVSGPAYVNVRLRAVG